MNIKKINGKRLGIFVALVMIPLFGMADDHVGEGSEPSAEELELLSLLEEQTDIATKTRINADFVPGMVTILLAHDLNKKGIKTVWQALGTVSGMEISLDKIGNQIVKVRHVGGSFASGNLKIMLNGVAMNSALTAMAQPAMDMPIEQIDRIEIFRGPGSAVHGEYAYAGVVNIISNRSEKEVYGSVGKYDSGIVGGAYDWVVPENHFKASLNMAFSDTDGADMHYEKDSLYPTGASFGMSQGSISNAPGPANEDRRYKSVLFGIDYHDFKLNAQWLNNRHGQHYGTFHVLPSADERDYTENEYKNLELRKKHEWSDRLSAQFQVGWLETTTENDLSILPPGYGIWHYPTFPTVLENGYQTAAYYKEQKYYLGADLFWQPIDKHQLLFAFSYSNTQVKEAWQKNNIHLNGTVSAADDFPIPIAQKFTAEDGLNWPSEDAKRKLNSITFQDEYHVFEPLYITLGVRYDHYSDVGSNLSPRVAAVYHWDAGNIFKAQYGQSFRPPTFFETAWTPELEPQTIDTYDFSYLYKGMDREFKLSLFHSKLKNLITATTPLGFFNGDGAVVYGAELEGEYNINRNIKLSANVSYSKSRVDETNEPVPRVANWLANGFFYYTPNAFFDLNVHYQYVGKRERELSDSREKLKAYHVFNVTGTLNDLINKGVSVQLGVDNLFDADVRYPSAMAADIFGNVFPSYEDDYTRPGRVWWLKLKYQFN